MSAPASHPPIPVLYASHEAELGGAERSLLELLRSLDRTRFTPHLAGAAEGPLADAARKLGVAVHDVPMRFHGCVRKGIGLLRAARTLRRLLARERIALVHTNTLIAGYCGVLAARAARIPSIWHVRDLGYPKLGRRAARAATWRIANSLATAAALGDPRTDVVYNGVGADFFAPHPNARRAVRRELGVPPRELLVAMVGRLDPGKGHRVLLDAAAILRAQRARATFLVIGDALFDAARGRLATYRHELESAAQNLGVARGFRFLGQRADVARLLAACDLLVHPATEPEAFGRAIAEAQAAGLPVIASHIGGIPELVTEGRDGTLVPPGDPTALAAALATLLADAPLRHRMGDAAREKAERCWTAAQHARAVEAVYARVLGLPQPAPAPAPAAPAEPPAPVPAGAGR
jgi:glycosyltransferase involved in cell wall biosynthesis